MKGTDAAPPLAEGRYRLDAEIGAGGMATVYRGFDERLQVARAIKILSPEYSARGKVRARFEVEARTMARLDHPNIVRVFDVGVDADRAFIVMELVEAGSLVDRVSSHGPLEARIAIDVIVDVLKALRAAHGAGVVHRDIKPHNILLCADGSVRVTDFGIARVVDLEQDALTRTGAVMGTWAFMPPEQRNDAKNVDAGADLYATGATLYSLLTNTTPMDLFAADMDPRMLGALDHNLAKFIRKATRYKRLDRFADADDMIAAALEVRARLAPLPLTHVPLVTPPMSKAPAPAVGDLVPDVAQKSSAPPGTPPAPTITPVRAPAAALSGIGHLETFDPAGLDVPVAGGTVVPAGTQLEGTPLDRPMPPPVAVPRKREATPSGGTLYDDQDDDVAPTPGPSPSGITVGVALALSAGAAALFALGAVGVGVYNARQAPDAAPMASAISGEGARPSEGGPTVDAAVAVAGGEQTAESPEDPTEDAAGFATSLEEGTTNTRATLADAGPDGSDAAEAGGARASASEATQAKSGGANPSEAKPSTATQQSTDKPATAAAAEEGALTGGSAATTAKTDDAGSTQASTATTQPVVRTLALAHSPPASASVGDTMTISARITGGTRSGSYDQVTVRIRPSGVARWQSRAMFESGDTWTAKVVITEEFAEGFEYFIDARSSDTDLSRLKSGSNQDPHSVRVK